VVTGKIEGGKLLKTDYTKLKAHANSRALYYTRIEKCYNTNVKKRIKIREGNIIYFNNNKKKIGEY
jgi:Zn/Cd-binding protein ZinT